MIWTLFIGGTLAYYLFLILWFHRKQRGEPTEDSSSEIPAQTVEEEHPEHGIIGKTTFVRRIVAQVTAKDSALIAREDNTVTFVAESGKEAGNKVPDEELDAVFSDTPLPTDNGEGLEIEEDDYEEKEDDAEDTPDWDAEEEDFEEEQIAEDSGFATGMDFEKLGKVGRLLASGSEMEEEDKVQTIEVVQQLAQTEILKQLFIQLPDAAGKVSRLLEERLQSGRQTTVTKVVPSEEWQRFDLDQFTIPV